MIGELSVSSFPLQAKRAPFARLRWLHLDSHPDLTLPSSLTPATVMDPPALYEALA